MASRARTGSCPDVHGWLCRAVLCTLPCTVLCRAVSRRFVDSTYSPPSDGMTSVLHAATVPWDKDRKTVAGTPVMPAEDLRWVRGGGGRVGLWPTGCLSAWLDVPLG